MGCRLADDIAARDRDRRRIMPLQVIPRERSDRGIFSPDPERRDA
jgi:hypothetical protein